MVPALEVFRKGGRRRPVAGAVVATVLVAAVAAAMVPLRDHLSVATTALVLVIPVVVGAATGGAAAGAVGTILGFIVYDFVFIPPYYTLSVGAGQNWVALGVYVVVTAVVTRVVVSVERARSDAQQRAIEVRRLFDLSELLVRDTDVPQLLGHIVEAMRSAFDLGGAALLLPDGDRLALAASAGTPLTDQELRALAPGGTTPVTLESGPEVAGGIRALPLSVSGQAIGLLVLRGLRGRAQDHEPVRAFANHLALALERADLREQALRAQVLEEVDRLRRSLVGAVSHDLRSPLATIKVSTTTLLDPAAPVTTAETLELLGLIDAQADRLDRLVSNVLDVTRIESGALELRREATPVHQLLAEARAVLGGSAELDRVEWRAPAGLPEVDVDPVLACQVVANLVDNATRYAPEGTPVVVDATLAGGGLVELAVTDAGPGVDLDGAADLFRMVNTSEAGGRGGLGLAIARAFVEAHGQRIWVERGAGGLGARFAFTLPVATPRRAG